MTEQEVREGYSQLTKLLINKKLTITTMESCTSGQIASLITDTEGASSVFKGAYVTYSNEAKIMAGVDSSIIEKYSVYSLETAESMAEVCRKNFNADIGIGVTGTMGNIDPVNSENSVPGEVYFSISTGEKTVSFKKQLRPESTRLAYKLSVAGIILEKLKQLVEFF